jgi:hypothetical protein
MFDVGGQESERQRVVGRWSRFSRRVVGCAASADDDAKEGIDSHDWSDSTDRNVVANGTVHSTVELKWTLQQINRKLTLKCQKLRQG